MSSSSKKKLRQEQVAAQKVKKQQTMKKESDKIKLYTGIFFVVLALMIVVVAVAAIDNSGLVEPRTTALKVGDTKVSASELNIYYIEAINEFYSANSSYLSVYGLDLYTSLDQQRSSDGSSSWADYFIDMAKEDIQYNYAVYNAALEAGYTLSEDAQANIDATLTSMEESAVSAGYDGLKDYLTALYGKGSTVETYRKALEVMSVATEYYSDYADSLTYTDDEIAAKDAEDPLANNLYSYSTYIMYASDYLEGGTEDEEGNITYSDDENAAALAACEANAKALVDAGYTTAAELEAAIAALPINEKASTSSTSMNREDIRYTSIASFMREWVTDPSRQPGDMTYLERATTNSDGSTTVGGYNVILFTGSDDNEFPLVNVRHILVSFEGGTTDSTTGETTYSTVEIAAAKEKAQEIYDAWLAGEATEETFAALANENSTDPGSNTIGGLYEDIYPGEMVDAFDEWCYDESRQVGDHALIETDYGYHIMYFSGYSDTTYRDYIITSDLRNADLQTWTNEVLSRNNVEDVNLSRVDRDLVLYNYFYYGY